MSEIDATDELDRIDEDRGKPDLGDKRRRIVPGGRLVLAASITTVLGLSAWAMYHTFDDLFGGFQPEPTPPTKTIPPSRKFTLPPAPTEAQAAVIEEPAPAEPEEPPTTPQLPPYNQPTVTVDAYGQDPPQPSSEEVLRQRWLSSPLSGESAPDAAPPPVAVAGGPEVEGGFLGSGDGDSVAGRLQPLRLQASTAGLLPDRDYLITQGTQIGCVLEIRIISTVPGLVVCRTTADVYSASGRAVLLDAGSKVIGQYGHGPGQGEERLFVTWNRLESPEGVIIALDSPAADSLGSSGVPGAVDNHYLQRFGGAILLSFIDDLFSALGRATTQVRGDRNQVSFTGTTDAANGIAEKALDATINIRPTLTLNQGTRLNVMVARDLDFRGVYEFQPR